MEIDVKILSGTTWTDILRSNILRDYIPADICFFKISYSYLVKFYFILQNQQRTYSSEASEGGGNFGDAATDDVGPVYCCKYHLT